MTEIDLPPATLKLLRQIARDDTGNGVLFRWLPRARYEAPDGTRYVQRSFYPLTRHGLVDAGDEADSTPVRITDAGRLWLEGR